MNQIKPLTDFNQIFALSQFAFQYELSEVKFEKKKEEAQRHIIWGWMKDNEQIAAKLHLIRLSCYINGEPFEMGGISSVATWPEYRRQGAVKQLLHHALKYMRENGQTISFLHPFSFAFYRKYGWEHFVSEKAYDIPIKNLKRTWEGKGYVRRASDGDTELLHTVYTEYAKNYNGTLVRDEKWWKQRVLNDNYHIAVAYNEGNDAEGYIIYYVKKNVLYVVEITNTSLNGKKLLLAFIANHDSMVERVEMIVPENDNLPLLVDEPKFEQQINPYFMARIVDVFAFLKHYPFLKADITAVTLKVADDFLPENSGVYQLSQIGKDTNVTFMRHQDKQNAVHVSIHYLTTMLLSYESPMELYNAGLIEGKREHVEQLEKVIPKRQTFFPDFF